MNIPPTSPFDDRRVRFSRHRSSFEGRDAVLLEGPCLLVVRVVQIQDDDWGVRVKIADSLLPGLARLPENVGELSAHWEGLSFEYGDLRAQYCWKLLFDPSLTCTLNELGTEARKRASTIAWADVMKALNDHFRRRLETPIRNNVS